jgi:hypothetical protein
MACGEENTVAGPGDFTCFKCGARISVPVQTTLTEEAKTHDESGHSRPSDVCCDEEEDEPFREELCQLCDRSIFETESCITLTRGNLGAENDVYVVYMHTECFEERYAALRDVKEALNELMEE